MNPEDINWVSVDIKFSVRGYSPTANRLRDLYNKNESFELPAFPGAHVIITDVVNDYNYNRGEFTTEFSCKVSPPIEETDEPQEG